MRGVSQKTGDLLRATEDYIAHQCNCARVASSSVRPDYLKILKVNCTWMGGDGRMWLTKLHKSVYWIQ